MLTNTEQTSVTERRELRWACDRLDTYRTIHCISPRRGIIDIIPLLSPFGRIATRHGVIQFLVGDLNAAAFRLEGGVAKHRNKFCCEETSSGNVRISISIVFPILVYRRDARVNHQPKGKIFQKGRYKEAKTSTETVHPRRWQEQSSLPKCRIEADAESRREPTTWYGAAPAVGK